jgi:hypothetical protein
MVVSSGVPDESAETAELVAAINTTTAIKKAKALQNFSLTFNRCKAICDCLSNFFRKFNGQILNPNGLKWRLPYRVPVVIFDEPASGNYSAPEGAKND